MLSFADKRWEGLWGGYRAPFDPRPALEKLSSENEAKEAWHELWEGLHHQGDVGEASYAAVPHLVQIGSRFANGGWNLFGLVATIELARGQGKNPDVPGWLRKDYFQAIRVLAEVGSSQIFKTQDTYDIRAMLSVLALAKGARTHARFLLEYSDDELVHFET
jgi:hypothetical protein